MEAEAADDEEEGGALLLLSSWLLFVFAEAIVEGGDPRDPLSAIKPFD